jgi:polysaccharide deacetylase family protein (PEP-CTERM system associated)
VTVHHFTVDVEEYFHVTALEQAVPRAHWAGMPSRVVPSTRQLMDLLGRHETRGTMFVLGLVAERHPQLVRDLAAAGHEIASHGWSHGRVFTKTPAVFREAVRKSKALLEDLTGRPVHGYRAPSFSIVPGFEWALDILIEEGYRYDSSIFPIRRPGYGYPGAPRDPHVLQRPVGSIVEVPPATLQIAGANLPAGGGAYFRLLPAHLTHAALRQAARRDKPATFYIHPWELDGGQPRVAVSALTRVRHYGGLHTVAGKLDRLLAKHQFRPIAETLLLENSWQAAH